MKLLSASNDLQLINLYKAGNGRAFDVLEARHKRALYTSIFLLVRDKFVAEDMLQDVFIKIINSIKCGRYNEEGKFLSWALRIARNYCLDYFRNTKRSPAITTAEYEDAVQAGDFYEESSETKMIRMQSNYLLEHMLNHLPEDQRKVIVFRHYDDMSFKEIAAATNCSINTALGRMRYGLINLRKLMEQKQVMLEAV